MSESDVMGQETGLADRPATRPESHAAPPAKCGRIEIPSAGDAEPGVHAEVDAATAHLYARVQHVIPPIEWPFHAPYVKAINDLKAVRNAVILAHNYMTPDIYHCVADIVGDSLALAKEATRRTLPSSCRPACISWQRPRKSSNPDKTVLIPDANAAARSPPQSRARMCDAARAVPGRAHCHLCQHLGRGEGRERYLLHLGERGQVVESLNAPRVIMIPDQYLSRYVASQTKVKIIAWKGACEVHERFTGSELARYRDEDPGVQIVAHPECPPDVLAIADFTGSTAAMIDFVKGQTGGRVVLVTECSMADNIAVEAPQVDFVRPCNLCPHMKRITLAKILDSLVTMTEEVIVAPDVAVRAKAAVERMIHLSM